MSTLQVAPQINVINILSYGTRRNGNTPVADPFEGGWLGGIGKHCALGKCAVKIANGKIVIFTLCFDICTLGRYADGSVEVGTDITVL